MSKASLKSRTAAAPKAATAHFTFDNTQASDLAGQATLPYGGGKLFNPAAQIMGDAASSDALRLIQQHTTHIKRRDTLTLLKESLIQFKAGNWQGGGESALKALHVDEKCGEAWHILAIAREKCGDLPTALTCYETALRLTPDNPFIANDLGRLAYRLGMLDLAEKFFLFFLDKCPGHTEAINNLASVMREANRLDDAIEVLRSAIQDNPSDAQLWNALGTIVNARGDMENAAIFYAEALKHDPNHVHALYNYGNARAVLGHVDEALDYLYRALPQFVDAMNVQTCKLSIAFCHLLKGNYREGWEWYQARNKDDNAEKIHYLIGRPHWEDGQILKGKRIFVSAEQGLGDEVMFASIIPDLLREVGPEGHVSLGVEPRLVPLFQKAFPSCTVVKHHTTKHKTLMVRLFPDVTDWDSYDYWAIMGDFLARYRSHIDDFPKTNTYFKPDPERVAYWKTVLDGVNDKPKVGVLWKSLINHSRRNRAYSPFEQWKNILDIKDIQFVNLQYGDVTEELEEARAAGLDIWTPPGIDLKNDLDDLSALCAAMDCLVGPANATSNIAGAAGVPVWMLSPERAWNSLGTDYFPWYPSGRVFFTKSLLDWGPVMAEMREALIEEFVTKRTRTSHVA